MSDYFDRVFITSLENNVNELRTLLASGARPREVYQIGEGQTATLLQLVIHKELSDVALLLLNHDIDVDKQDSSGNTALHTAVVQGNVRMVKLLLENGANPDIHETLNQETPLHVAARNGDAAVVSVLLEHGANREARAQGGITPLVLASHGGHLQVARLLNR